MHAIRKMVVTGVEPLLYTVVPFAYSNRACVPPGTVESSLWNPWSMCTVCAQVDELVMRFRLVTVRYSLA